jgi:hypothetical protein
MEDMEQRATLGDSGNLTTGTNYISMHCANDCPYPDAKFDLETGLYPCGYRHWCPWCGDCEYCYDEGPHDWD